MPNLVDVVLSTPDARIGLGLAAIGRPAYITVGHARDLPADRSEAGLRARAHELLDAAYAAGVRYLDAARSYGLAEDFLAGWLLGRPDVNDVAVGSKWGYTYVGGWQVDAPVHEIKDHSLATFERQLAESRALLGDCLSIYQVHSLTTESPVLVDKELQRRLAELAAQGVTIGFSSTGPRQADTIRAAIELTVDGAPLFRSVQATWNVLEPSASDALAEAQDSGCVVIVKEALANGRLAGLGSEHVDVVLAEIAGELGTSPDAVAVAAALAQPWATVVLSGAAVTEHLASNLCAATIRLGSDHFARLAGLVEPPDQYWVFRSGLDWT